MNLRIKKQDLEKQEDYNNLYGIFIGIESFPKSRGAIRGLLHANQDADELCQLFYTRGQERKRPYKLSLMVDHAYAQSIGMRNDVTVRIATRTNILREVTTYIAEAKSGDLLLLYISTHGVIDYDDYFFVPTDGELDNILGTGIASSTLIRAVGKASGVGVKTLVIIDTCHAGAMSFDLSKYPGEFSCLLSSSPVEYSYEFFDIEHGIFTNYLLDGLKNSGKQGGQISLIELYEYVYKNVQLKTHKRQNPLLIGTMGYDTVLFAMNDASLLQRAKSKNSELTKNSEFINNEMTSEQPTR